MIVIEVEVEDDIGIGWGSEERAWNIRWWI